MNKSLYLTNIFFNSTKIAIMKLLKILQYVYLFFFVAFLYDAITKWNAEGESPYLSLGLAALALFMFFFRKKYRKRFEDRGKL